MMRTFCLGFACLVLWGCSDDAGDGGGGAGNTNAGGSGGTAGTGTGTGTSTSIDTGPCVSGNILPDPCCMPFDLEPSDCPAEMPAPGSPCEEANGVCYYPENCGHFPDLVDVPLHCKHESLIWARLEPGQPFCPDGFSEVPVQCPCAPPAAGETCGFSVVSQISPCTYAACETYECDNRAGSVWELIACAP